MTYYPHTIDNSFAGFVIYPSNSTPTRSKLRKNLALIYAKKSAFVKGNEDFLHAVSESFELHSTMAEFASDSTVEFNSSRGSFPVKNHGQMDPEKYIQFLGQFKIMVGMGFPYEGPTPLEAMTNGIIFIQPTFIPAKGRWTNEKGAVSGDILVGSNFWVKKPMFRLLTSQVPFIEQMPFQRTINYQDEDQVHTTLAQILNNEHPEGNETGFTPAQLTTDSLIHRMSQTIQTSDFCQPPEANAELVIIASSVVATNCIEACEENNLTCATEYFQLVNDEEYLLQHSGNNNHS